MYIKEKGKETQVLPIPNKNSLFPAVGIVTQRLYIIKSGKEMENNGPEVHISLSAFLF